jgi:LemA protein
MLLPWIIGGVIVLALVLLYNGLVSAKNRTEEAWSDIDVQQKRRYDLIPNLINTVKGYATHEANTLEALTAARAKAMQGGSVEDQNAQENMLTGALKTVFAVAENYPDLKANTNFLELQRELSDTENKIMAARRFYNSSVMDLNTKIESFPTSIFAGLFGFAKKTFFEVSEAEKAPVEVSF